MAPRSFAATGDSTQTVARSETVNTLLSSFSASPTEMRLSVTTPSIGERISNSVSLPAAPSPPFCCAPNAASFCCAPWTTISASCSAARACR
jgi:hypothetical protein